MDLARVGTNVHGTTTKNALLREEGAPSPKPGLKAKAKEKEEDLQHPKRTLPVQPHDQHVENHQQVNWTSRLAGSS